MATFNITVNESARASDRQTPVVSLGIMLVDACGFDLALVHWSKVKAGDLYRLYDSRGVCMNGGAVSQATGPAESVDGVVGIPTAGWSPVLRTVAPGTRVEVVATGEVGTVISGQVIGCQNVRYIVSMDGALAEFGVLDLRLHS